MVSGHIELITFSLRASLTRWTRVWASSRNWWWTGKPGMLQSMGLQRVGHDWATEWNWAEFWHQIIWLETILLLLKALRCWANHFYPLSSCFSSLEWEVYACSVTYLCLTLRDSTDNRPPGSSVHGIFQARILEWAAISFSNKIVKHITTLLS